jgi:serine/threonine-protein kinase
MSSDLQRTRLSSDDPALLRFAELLELPREARSAELDKLAPDLRVRVEALLRADSQFTDPVAAAIAASAGTETTPMSVVGAYRLVRELGAGGMGAVYLAERADQQYQAKVAIKFIRGFATRDGVRRLRIERQLLAELDHPYITRLIDGGETAEGQPYLVMEYVEGHTLDAYIEQRRPALAARLELYDRILDAVGHAHGRLIVHRDIKPNNILVRSDGTPKLLDFGVAKLLDALADEGANTSTLVWTPGYSSPEQSDGRRVGVEADIFSLGVVLSEVLGTDQSPELRAIVAMASAREVEARYRNVEALRDDLRRFRDGLPVRAVRATRRYRLRKFLWRRRWPLALAASATLLAAVFTWQLNLQRERAIEAEKRARTELVRAQIAEREAREQSQRAEQTEGFLIDVFAEADPNAASARQVDLLKLLAAAAERSAVRFADQPALLARVRRTLGGVYRNLGEAKAALALLEASIPSQDPDEATLGLELASSLVDYGSMRMRADDVPAAIAAFERAARLRERFAPNDPALALQRYVDLAAANIRAGEFDVGERWAIEGIASARAIGMPGNEALAQLLGSLAELRMEQRRHADALRASSEALAIAEKLPRRNDYALVDLMRQQASVLVNNDQLDAAETQLQQALSLQRRWSGDRGSQYANIINDLAVLYVQRGHYSKALPLLEESLAAEQRAINDDGLGVAISYHNLASTWLRYGDYPRAIELFERAAAQVRDLSLHHRRQFLSGRSRAEIFGGLWPQAERSLIEFENLILTDPEATDSNRLELAMRRLGLAYVRGQDPGAAISAVESAMAAIGEPPQSLLANIDYLIGVSLIRSAPTQAQERLTRCLKTRTDLLGSEHVDTALAALALARAELALGQSDAAASRFAAHLPTIRSDLLETEYDRQQIERGARLLIAEPR